MFETNKFIVREYFRKMIGEEGMRIMGTVPEGEITDEEIARLSDTKLTAVRKVLYTLYENRIAEYRTERDDTSGWITYLWRFNYDNIKKIMGDEADGLLTGLNSQLEDERKGVFYQCSCQRISFEEAAAKDFMCDECNSNFEYVDNQDLIGELEEKIEEIEQWKREIKKG
uniref:Transcription factor E n=1 Tax=Candidatus Methanophagaceae archaeon ANME-1 ERB6 TaxID=2759912 RepID=A0A7G9YTW8_9EURY|nr:transcription factor E [Methanosarcinales archaeon ANME-1 ERB6]